MTVDYKINKTQLDIDETRYTLTTKLKTKQTGMKQLKEYAIEQK